MPLPGPTVNVYHEFISYRRSGISTCLVSSASAATEFKHTPPGSIGRIRHDRPGNPAPCGHTSVIAGRLVRLEPHARTGALKDWSGTIELALADPPLSEILDLLSEGDLVECTGRWGQDAYDVTAMRLLVPSLRDAPEPGAAYAVGIRARLLAQTRSFFDSRGFISVDTPTFMDGAGPDTCTAFLSDRFRGQRGRVASILPADLAGTLHETPAGFRLRTHIPDMPVLPQRRTIRHPPSRIHRSRVVRSLCRLREREWKPPKIM